MQNLDLAENPELGLFLSFSELFIDKFDHKVWVKFSPEGSRSKSSTSEAILVNCKSECFLVYLCSFHIFATLTVAINTNLFDTDRVAMAGQQFPLAFTVVEGLDSANGLPGCTQYYLLSFSHLLGCTFQAF